MDTPARQGRPSNDLFVTAYMPISDNHKSGILLSNANALFRIGMCMLDVMFLFIIMWLFKFIVYSLFRWGWFKYVLCCSFNVLTSVIPKQIIFIFLFSKFCIDYVLLIDELLM